MATAVNSPPIIALTAGEPAGIGPDLCVMLARQTLAARIVVIVDRSLLLERAQLLGIPLKLQNYAPGVAAEPGELLVQHQPLIAHVTPGTLNHVNSRYVLQTIDRAVAGCLQGEFDALVTGPVHKGAINDAGIAFTGHTEYLAKLTGAAQVVMMLVGGGMRVALATTHLALKDVSAAINRAGLESTLRIIQNDFARRLGIAKPRVIVAGLNPHAGESGHLGREEIEVIIPVLDKLRSEGFALVGPLPADTLFTPQRMQACDCVLAMYHDQGLPVLKYASFGGGVNVTLGLPVVRASVDHGTALELAGSGKVEIGSLLAAIELAAEMALHPDESNNI